MSAYSAYLLVFLFSLEGGNNTNVSWWRLNMSEYIIPGLKNRILQIIAQFSPGASSIRIFLHRLRGVRMGKNVWIGYDSIIGTSKPHWIYIGNNVEINVRVIIIAHLQDVPEPNEGKGKDYISVKIEDNAHIGPGTIILPNVTIGQGAVVTAGSVVTRSIPPMIMVQGNPAKPIASCGVPFLTRKIPRQEFFRKLKPIKKKN